MTFGAEIDESGFEAGFDPGDPAFVDVGLLLLARPGFDIRVVETLAIHQGYTQLFGLSCVNQHSFMLYRRFPGCRKRRSAHTTSHGRCQGAQRVAGHPVSNDIRHQPVAQPAVVATTRPVLRCLAAGVVEPSTSSRCLGLPRCIAIARRSLATTGRGALPGKPWHSKVNPRTTVQATCTQSGGGISRGPWTLSGCLRSPGPLARPAWGWWPDAVLHGPRSVHLHPARIPDSSGAAAR